MFRKSIRDRCIHLFAAIQIVFEASLDSRQKTRAETRKYKLIGFITFQNS